MEEGELLSLQDLIRVKVYDEEDTHIGHLQDLALERDPSSPYVTCVGVHFEWIDRVGATLLPRRVEDIVLLVPWLQVNRMDKGGVHLNAVHPNFPAQSAQGKCLLRGGILNKQMVDAEGNRIQRVDDVLLEKVENRLKVIGLEVSLTWLPAGAGLQHMLERFKEKYMTRHDVEMVPWEAVLRIDRETLVIGVDA